jgi:hypothetical protein
MDTQVLDSHYMERELGARQKQAEVHLHRLLQAPVQLVVRRDLESCQDVAQTYDQALRDQVSVLVSVLACDHLHRKVFYHHSQLQCSVTREGV